MCGAYVETLRGFGLRPSGEHAAARKHERMRTVTVNDGEFQIAVERRTRNIFPHENVATPMQ